MDNSQITRVVLTYSSHDVHVLAQTIFGEARDQSWMGKVGVGSSIRNRAEMDLHNDGKPDWWGEGIAGVSLKLWQYSSWNPNDTTNRPLMLAATPDPSFAQYLAYRECLAVAAYVLSDQWVDPTHGSANYKRFDVPAAWAVGHTPVWREGVHEFYNDIQN